MSTKRETRVHAFCFMKALSPFFFILIITALKVTQPTLSTLHLFLPGFDKNKDHYNQEIIENPCLRKFCNVKKIGIQ